MGFRAQSSTTHLAQLLTDVMVMQKRKQQPLWLASFDVDKCFPSLPWWAVFGVLAEAGVPPSIVACFCSFYTQLRQRFRYGQVDGGEWRVANGLAQGCPASPDMLNIVFEVFHRWAAAQQKGVFVDGAFLASTSFADDVVLVATSWDEMVFLITAYLEWCRLLGLKVNIPKTQLWCNEDVGRAVTLAAPGVTVSLTTGDTFRVVGIELGMAETSTTKKHAEPRIAKALLAGKRLAALPVPAAVAAQMWRSTVLAQALYGCEVRHLSDTLLRPLRAQGRLMLAHKAPLALSCYGAMEAISGPPLGACALRHPTMEVLLRQLTW